MYMNQLTIIGFTGQDADFHYTPNGTAVTTFSKGNIDNLLTGVITPWHPPADQE